VWDLLGHLWIPVIILGTEGTAALIRVMRANLLDELRKPYVVTARAKGLPEWKVILKYPVRLALNPFVSTVGWVLPGLVSGSAILSIVLSLPTTGPILLRALLSQDMYLAASSILMLSVLTVIGTLLSDLLLAWLDPRIRYE
jgi:peptide/nickel transport system permease protein